MLRSTLQGMKGCMKGMRGCHCLTAFPYSIQLNNLVHVNVFDGCVMSVNGSWQCAGCHRGLALQLITVAFSVVYHCAIGY